jgi:hypothetical protein
MTKIPESVAAFLRGRRFAVAGVSRDGSQAANAVFRKLRACGHEVVPINPSAPEVEGATCYPDLRSVPGSIDGVVVATHPSISVQLVRQCDERRVGRVVGAVRSCPASRSTSHEVVARTAGAPPGPRGRAT